jgi:pimeloyl-ACP methyl ester carboxylesterase
MSDAPGRRAPGPGASRRSLLAGLAGLAAAGCSRRRGPGGEGEGTSPTTTAHEGFSTLDLRFAGASAEGGATRAAVLVPKGQGPYPILVALHGRGEAVRGAEVGAYGWLRDYHLGAAVEALGRGHVTADDLQGFVLPGRPAALDRSLAARPYGGLIVACPHLPDQTGPGAAASIERYGRWVVEQLLPRVRAESPGGEAASIDGVSLGGRVALYAGLAHPEAFRAVGSLQAAIRAPKGETRGDEAELVGMTRSYLAARPEGKVRLLTSDRDYFLTAIESLHHALDEARLPHEHLVVAGPHDYSFNQGPGGIEMLLWHDRVLRGLPAP